MVNRNISIDLLRIIAMLMIVIWHSTNHGSLAQLSDDFDWFNVLIHFMQSLTCVAVDVYVLISGYFLCTQSFRISRLFKLWIQVFFYSIIVLFVCISFNFSDIQIIDLRYFLLPISYRTNWFVSSYIGLCLLSPILNILISSINQKQHFGILCFLIAITSIWHDLLPMSFGLDIYDGKRVAWFVVLYLISSYIRKYIDVSKISSCKCFGMYLLSCLLQVTVWAIIFNVCNLLNLNENIRQRACDYYFYYGSCFTAFSALMIFLSFLGLTNSSIHQKRIMRIIIKISPFTFGVYLIHDNPFLRDIIWAPIKSLSETGLSTIIYAILYSLFLFIVCIAIDSLRSLLFSPLFKSKYWSCFVSKIDNYFSSIYNKITSII